MNLLTDEEQQQVRTCKESIITVYEVFKERHGEPIALKALRDANQQAIGESVERQVNSYLAEKQQERSLINNGSQPQD